MGGRDLIYMYIYIYVQIGGGEGYEDDIGWAEGLKHSLITYL